MVSPSQAKYLEVLAYTFLQNGKYERALIVFLTLKRLLGDKPKILLARAYAYLQLNAYEAVYEEAQLADQLTSDLALKNLARILQSKALWHMGKPEQAWQILMNFLEHKQRTHSEPLAYQPSSFN